MLYQINNGAVELGVFLRREDKDQQLQQFCITT